MRSGLRRSLRANAAMAICAAAISVATWYALAAGMDRRGVVVMVAALGGLAYTVSDHLVDEGVHDAAWWRGRLTGNLVFASVFAVLLAAVLPPDKPTEPAATERTGR